MKIFRLALPILIAGGLAAQTAETIPYRAVLSNTNEVPPPATAATGAATILLHIVRDAAGKIVSGSVDANVSYKFPGPVTITGMHIHGGPAGANAGIVLPFAITRTDDSTGAGALPPVQTQFPSTAVSLDTINGILADPGQYYFNIHTTESPGGAMRGQLQRAEMVVRIGLMKPENETPPISGQTWSGLSTVTALITRDSTGAPTSARVTFDGAYSGFPDGTTFTGYHIHLGGAGAAGPVTINTGLRNLAATEGGGTLHYDVEADVSQKAVVDTLNALVSHPWDTYINIHTSVAPGGAVRSQLMATDHVRFPVLMLPSNEVPAITSDASAAAVIGVYTVRNPDGSVAAGTVVFDTNPRLPSGSTITAMHIHDQVAGQNGPVTIDSGLASSPLLTSDGSGNVYRVAQVRTATALASLNSLVVNPERHYVNMHTSANPGGAIRSQLADAVTSNPLITYVESAVQDPRITTVAPGELVFIAGQNLAKVPGDLSGFNGLTAFPGALNGIGVTIGGVRAPIQSVAPDRVFAQVPFEVAVGSAPVVVTNGNGSSPAFNVTVAPVAPAIFNYDYGAVAYRLSDFSLVSPGNPAGAGEMIAVFATGLGQTAPVQQTGNATPDGMFVHTAVSANIGGKQAESVQAVSAPGFVGVSLVLLTIPQGLPAGNATFQLQMGSTSSNISSISIR